MDIQLEKALIIEQLKHIDDADLIHALKSLLKYSSKKEEMKDFIVPEWQKELVRQRRTELKDHPEGALSWDDIMEELDS
jgi:hypothetical protein